jgi:hypothetical protein
MKTRTFNLTLALWTTAALAFSSCSDPAGPDPGAGGEPSEEFPTTYPPIPRPTAPDEVIPDQSEVYAAISPIAGKALDFAPLWTDGVFTWNIDVQTQYQNLFGQWGAYAPGDYWNGTAHNSTLVFENGVVDLRSPTPYGTSWGEPHPRRILFVENGSKLATPRNPDEDTAWFLFQNYDATRFDGALFSGYVTVEKEPSFGQKTRRAAYYVAAMSSPQLTNPVYIKRERYWKRLPLGGDGNNLKSIRVDPGSTFEVKYTRTQGTSYAHSYTFTRTLSGEVSVQAPKEVVGAKLGGSLSEAFGSSVEITEESSVEVTRTMTGIEDKTVIYSVWTSVEHYTVVDKNGNPYTDPNFTFEDLGSSEIQGEYEWISSTAFDYE